MRYQTAPRTGQSARTVSRPLGRNIVRARADPELAMAIALGEAAGSTSRQCSSSSEGGATLRAGGVRDSAPGTRREERRSGEVRADGQPALSLGFRRLARGASERRLRAQRRRKAKVSEEGGVADEPSDRRDPIPLERQHDQ
jgi:hypothetical protein